MNILKRISSWFFPTTEKKLIESVVAIGDIIEVEHCGNIEIYKVEDFRVILNHNDIRPIDWVIHVKFSNNNGNSSIECTSDQFKYIRHIN